MTKNNHFDKIAILIDGDNVSPSTIGMILDKIMPIGNIACKQIYGDFKQGNLSAWDDISLEFLLTQIHVPAYVKGKNATDIALAIDAIDLSYQGFDCFCIVSSDSDFSILAKNLRGKNKTVIGIGSSKAITSFQKACDYFWIIDTPSKTKSNPTLKPIQTTQPTQKPAQITSEKLRQDTKLINVCTECVDLNMANGWAIYSQVVSTLNQNYPDIKPKNYGYSKWRSLFNQLNLFEIKIQDSSTFIRPKDLVNHPNTTNNKPTITDKKLLSDIVEILNDNPYHIDGWTHIGQLGSELSKKGYIAKDYGYKNFGKLIVNVDCVEIKIQNSALLIRTKNL